MVFQLLIQLPILLGSIRMLNMYKSEATECRYDNIRVHPSPWFLSALTREIFALVFMIPGLLILAGAFLALWNAVTLALFSFLIFLICFLLVRYFHSYKMKGHVYNDKLLPLEKRYHRMSKQDQKLYRHYLESAYAMCGHRGEMDDKRLTKIEQLFKLKEIEANVLYDALDDELELAQQIVSVRQDAQKEIEMIKNKVKR